MRNEFKLGVVINPFAGIGGSVGLKGSDGDDIRDKALAMGAPKLANQKMGRALNVIKDLSGLHVFTAGGEMGEACCAQFGFPYQVIYQPTQSPSSANDTEEAVKALVAIGVDLILFAGGDGTARNVCAIAGDSIPVLGVPAGCKIHSGVYAVTPVAAGEVIRRMLTGELVSVRQAEVRDIDEQAFRQGKVQSQHYGEMQIPDELNYVQSVKMGGREDESLVLNDIADYISDLMHDEPDTVFVMGSGSTVNQIMQTLSLPNTLLGVDIVRNQKVIEADVTADILYEVVKNNPTRMVITAIGGQGHVFGRGNQQLTPAVIRRVGRDNIWLVATKQKLQQLEGRPLRLDTGDDVLDSELAGIIPVITGYQDKVYYPIK